MHVQKATCTKQFTQFHARVTGKIDRESVNRDIVKHASKSYVHV